MFTFFLAVSTLIEKCYCFQYILLHISPATSLLPRVIRIFCGGLFLICKIITVHNQCLVSLSPLITELETDSVHYYVYLVGQSQIHLTYKINTLQMSVS